MKIKEDGFIYNVAFLGNLFKKQISLCKIFWRFLLGFFIFWPLILVLGSFCIACISIVVFLIAKRFTSKNPPAITTHFRRWPTVRGHRVYPISIIIPAIAVYGIYILSWPSISSSIITYITTALDFFIKHGGIFFLSAVSAVCIIAILIIAWGIIIFWRSEVGLLFREYCSAVHRKVCPFVEIIPVKLKEEKD